MSQKFLIVVLIAIFYNGVVHASSMEEHHTERIPTEEKSTASSVSIGHKNVEPTNVSSSVYSAPGTEKSAEIPVVKVTTLHPDTTKLNISVVPHVIDSKSVTPDSISKNITSSVAPDVKNISQLVDGKNSTPTKEAKNISVPVVPSEKNTTGFPSSNASSTLSTLPIPASSTSPTTTLKTTGTTKAEATTVASTPASSEKVDVAHSVPTTVQEKQFDGPSFIGGIVLTLGLTAIGFIAFKYYKSGKIGMNYRTL